MSWPKYVTVRCWTVGVWKRWDTHAATWGRGTAPAVLACGGQRGPGEEVMHFSEEHASTRTSCPACRRAMGYPPRLWLSRL